MRECVTCERTVGQLAYGIVCLATDLFYCLLFINKRNYVYVLKLGSKGSSMRSSQGSFKSDRLGVFY